MIWQLVKTLVVLALLAAVGWGVWREAGPVTAACVGLVGAAIMGLDRRTRAMDVRPMMARFIEEQRQGGGDPLQELLREQEEG